MEKAAQKYSGKSVTQLADYFCANIYSEALNIEKRGFPAEEMDLLMEQSEQHYSSHDFMGRIELLCSPTYNDGLSFIPLWSYSLYV